jgi:hypothetical protein
VLYQGTWQKSHAKTEGSWKILGSEYGMSGRKLELSSDFKTEQAPDLRIYVSPMAFSKLNDDNATKDAKLIAELKSEKGAQTYDIPTGVKLDDFKSILINSKTYAKLWCGSDLETASSEK